MNMQNHSEQLKAIRTFPQLVKYLRDELDWPIGRDDFEDISFPYTPEELGIELKVAAKIQEIRRLRPLTANQPWGIFFIKFEPKRLPVVALRRMLKAVALKKRATADSAERLSWDTEDLLFISNYGEEDSRQITFAQFTLNEEKKDLPTLKVLGWDNKNTALHLDHVAESLATYLTWPDDQNDTSAWRSSWRSAFTIRHREVIDTAKKLSVQLAQVARNIRKRINTVLDYETENGPITKLMNAFKEALVHDLDNDGFADMYAQTIAYGLLSARIANPSGKTADDFASAMPVTNPFLKELMETFIDVGGRTRSKGSSIRLDFDELGVSEIVELLDAAKMEAVVRDFGDKNPLEDPVTHFYEQFFADYDNSERFKRGVFYTPRPVVSYIVRSVDEILRADFSLEYGLADTSTWREIVERNPGIRIPHGTSPEQAFVQILDPATGTGTFLVEVINLVHSTMIEKWGAEGRTDQEIGSFWNRYVSKHLLPRMHGYELLMAPYSIAHMKIGLKLHETGYDFRSDERVGVFLTNALEPAADYVSTMDFALPALAHESEAVNEVKRNKCFTIVIGNPPYSKASQNLGEKYLPLIESFRYFDEEKIQEPGAILFERDINNDYIKFVGFVCNHAALSEVCVLGMITSSSYLDGKNFRGVRDTLINTFSSIYLTDLHGDNRSRSMDSAGIHDENVFDIETGVSIIQASVCGGDADTTSINYTDIVGTYHEKANSLLDLQNKHVWKTVTADSRRYKSLIPSESLMIDEYTEYTQIDNIFKMGVDGIKTSRDGLVIANTAEECISKIRLFMEFDDTADKIAERFKISVRSWDYRAAQRHLQETISSDKVHRLSYRPFDFRYIYLDPVLVFSDRGDKMAQLAEPSNQGFVCASRLSSKGFDHILPTESVVEMKYASHDTNSRVFPMHLIVDQLGRRSIIPNASNLYSERFSVQNEDEWENSYSVMFALLNSSVYRSRYYEEIKNDFPALPGIIQPGLMQELNEYGRQLIDIQLLKNEYHDGAFVVKGHYGESLQAPKLKENKLYLSDNLYLQGVMNEVFEFRIAGYQVCKTWVSAGNRSGIQRKGQIVTEELVHDYIKVLGAIRQTMEMRVSIDDAIVAHGGWPGAFQPNN